MSDMNFSGVDFTGLANLNIGDLRDSQGRYPMDPGYDPAPATEVSSPVYAGGTLDRPTAGGEAPVYAGGTLDRPTAGGEAPVVTPINSSASAFSPNPDARNTIKAVLASYGLDALSEVLWSNYSGGLVDVTNPQALIYSIRNEPAYKERFKANDARMKAGLPELSPGEYIGLEDQYKQVVRSNGLPAGFYDTTDDITKLISGDVSPSEFQSRITNGYNAVANADPEVRRQMQDLYGVSEGHLAAYFLDPTRGEPLLQQQAQAAKIAARGLESGGMQLSKATAEDLAARGITEGQAQQGFGNIGQLGELTTQMAGETGLTQGQIVGQAFGYDTQAALELAKRARRRVGEFAGGGEFARTQGQTSGAIQTAVGTAQ